VKGAGASELVPQNQWPQNRYTRSGCDSGESVGATRVRRQVGCAA